MSFIFTRPIPMGRKADFESLRIQSGPEGGIAYQQGYPKLVAAPLGCKLPVHIQFDSTSRSLQRSTRLQKVRSAPPFHLVMTLWLTLNSIL